MKRHHGMKVEIGKSMGMPALFKGIGLKATAQRQEILQTFYDNEGPMTADQIAAKMSKVDMVTLYRTLETFVKYRLIKKLNLSTGITFYEISDTHHHHIVCSKCNLIEEVDSCEIGTLVPHSKKFSFISEHSLEFFGICKSCAKS